ncbi:MAG: NAD(+)/NADH kinase [Anaerolineae bacterium]|nr:NAD(+)/NADH kinase [Anaerolineae bacterium]
MASISKPHRLAFHHVGVLYNPQLTEARVMAAEILEFLESLGVSAWVNSSSNEDTVRDLLAPIDLLIVLGGDGSILRAARITANYDIPILGINMGHLGFLVEVQPAEWPELIKQALWGDYWIEYRMVVYAEHRRDGQTVSRYEALNEVVISRGQMARVVRLNTYIDGGFLTTYIADGLILATSTGSTAYALAAGGPILPPELENFLLVPIAPHLSLDRALVLSKGATVRIQVSTDHKAVLTVDGQIEIEIAHRDEVIMKAGPWRAQFLRLREKNYFYQTLMHRLGWPHPKKR